MIKKLTKFFLYIVVLLTTALVYLSFFGINTKSFNQVIEEKVLSINNNIKLELDKVKIILNIKNLSISIKTQNPNLIYQSKKFKLNSIKTNLSIASFFSKDFSIYDLEISIKNTKLKNIIELLRSFRNSPELFVLENLIKDGFIVADINLNFDKKGNIKNNFKISGSAKKVKLRLLNKKFIKDLNFNFQVKNDDYIASNISVNYNELKFNSKIINIKKKQNLFLIKGEFKNKEKNLDVKLLDEFLKSNFNSKGLSPIDFDSHSIFSFKINKKLKIRDINFETKINLDKLNYKFSNLNLNDYLPQYDNHIELNKHELNISYKEKKLIIDGKGKFLIGNKPDTINYKVTNKNDSYEFITDISLKNNPLLIDFLQYEKKENIKSKINFAGSFNKDKGIYLDTLSLTENKNEIIINGLAFNKSLKILKLDKVKLNFISKNKIKNEINIKRNKNNYEIKGKSFDADYLIEKILNYNDESKSSILLDNFNSNIKISVDDVYINNNLSTDNLLGNLLYKKNTIVEANLKSTFPSDKKLKLTINTNENNETITTFFSDNAKPFVKRYKFIKGFEDGRLDFYSIKKNDKSKSQLKIYDFKLNELPALTKILTLASLQGIADILTGEGIRFNELEMNFSNNKNIMNIEEIYAIGPAISILLDGYIERNKLISLSGTLVPATTVNKVIGSIPILGNILVGKKAGEGVFGVSFKIKGPPNKIKTTVNPIKTLTPRFITRTLEKIKKN